MEKNIGGRRMNDPIVLIISGGIISLIVWYWIFNGHSHTIDAWNWIKVKARSLLFILAGKKEK